VRLLSLSQFGTHDATALSRFTYCSAKNYARPYRWVGHSIHNMFSLLARFQSLSVSFIYVSCCEFALSTSSNQMSSMLLLTCFQLIGLWGAESDDAMGDGVSFIDVFAVFMCTVTCVASVFVVFPFLSMLFLSCLCCYDSDMFLHLVPCYHFLVSPVILSRFSFLCSIFCAVLL
jgi:hypothetical protein